jgi:hypothetical protein
MEIVKKSWSEVMAEQIVDKSEGLVCLGCGGDFQEWVTGITNSLHEEGIIHISDPEKVWDDVIHLETTGGRTDLVFMFSDISMDMGKMAIWRIQMGFCTWLSDYVVNYADQH